MGGLQVELAIGGFSTIPFYRFLVRREFRKPKRTESNDYCLCVGRQPVQYFFDTKWQAASGFGLAICCTRLASYESTNTQYASHIHTVFNRILVKLSNFDNDQWRLWAYSFRVESED